MRYHRTVCSGRNHGSERIQSRNQKTEQSPDDRETNINTKEGNNGSQNFVRFKQAAQAECKKQQSGVIGKKLNQSIQYGKNHQSLFFDSGKAAEYIQQRFQVIHHPGQGIFVGNQYQNGKSDAQNIQHGPGTENQDFRKKQFSRRYGQCVCQVSFI